MKKCQIEEVLTMDELYIYRNELKNKIIPKYKIIGISSELILSKELFKNNIDIVPFIEVVFSTSFRPYVIKSRTLLLARVSSLINDYSDEQLFNVKTKLYNYIGKALTNQNE